jgi:hypothetical protein
MIDKKNFAKPEKDYSYFASDWQKCRDAKAGQRAIHEGGTRYLPMLGGMEEDTDGHTEYTNFKKRTSFYNATKRTIKAFVGLLFNKSPKVSTTPSLQYFVTDATDDDKTLNQAAYFTADELLTVGRVGALVEYSTEEYENKEPYLCFFATENILEVKTERSGNKNKIKFIKLNEDDGEKIRVLLLEDGIYKQEIYLKDDKKEFYLSQEIYPIFNDSTISEIPFFIFNVNHDNKKITSPPMVDLVNLNLNHYQFMASYAHGIFYTGFPTPFLFGVNDREIPKGIGVRELWTSSNPDAKAGMLEFTGAGLSFAREYLEDRKNEMASLGARFLGSETKKTETAEKTKLDQFGEASSLAEIAEIISEQFTKILKFLSEIKGEDSKDVFFELSKEFTPQDISPEMVKTLSYELQSGHISYQTFFDNLQKGKIISERRTQEAELDDISNQVLTQ